MFISPRDVFHNVTDPVRLRELKVSNQSGDLDECLAAGVGKALVFSSGRVRLAWGPCNDQIYALRVTLENRWAKAVGIEGESPVPGLKGSVWKLIGVAVVQEVQSVGVRVNVRPGVRGDVVACSQEGFQPCGNAITDFDEVEWAVRDIVGSATQQSGVVRPC